MKPEWTHEDWAVAIGLYCQWAGIRMLRQMDEECERAEHKPSGYLGLMELLA